MVRRGNQSVGTLAIIGSAMAYSLSGYFTRSAAADIWTVLFWRGIFGGIFIAACVALQDRKMPSSLFAMGRAGLWVTLFSTLATICYIAALRLAPVAEVMTVHATLPFVTSVLGYCLIG